MSTHVFPYHTTDRGLRKIAARNDVRLVKDATGWVMLDSNFGSLIADGLTSVEVQTMLAGYES